jgi:hypothetical protein
MDFFLSIDNKEYDLSQGINWEDPQKVNKLRELRVLTDSNNFHPFAGFLKIYQKEISIIKNISHIFEKKERLVYLNVSNNINTFTFNSLVCCYLISQNLPEYYYLSMSELLEIHFGGVGIRESFRLLLNSYPCLVVDCGKTVAKNDFKSTALGILIESVTHSKNKVLLVNQQANIDDATKDLLEKDDIWEKVFYPNKLKTTVKSFISSDI